MAQTGLHALIGLAITQMDGQEAEGFATRPGGFKWGFVLGTMLPDADTYVVAPMLLFVKDATLVFHRTWSHSVLTQTVVCLLAYFLWARRSPHRQGLVTGLALGMLVHTATDLFLWFSHVNLLWPLGLFGLQTDFNAWTQVNVPGVVGNLLGAAEFLTLGLFFGYLIRLANASRVDLNRVPSLRRAEWLMYLLTLVAAVLAFFLSPAVHTMVIFPVVGLVGLTLAWWFLWHMREAIARAPALIKARQGAF